MTADRIMLDSTDPAVILAAVKAGHRFDGLPIGLAAGYLDGRYAWPASAWAELEAAGIAKQSLVGITVLGSGGEAGKAGAGDSEPGDMSPAAAAAWALAEHKAVHWPTIYCDRSHKAAVISECAKLGLHHAPSGEYGLWVATLDGTFTDLDGSDLRTQAGVVAVQYLGAAAAGIDVDVSLVVASWWRAAPPPPPVKVLDGYLVTAGGAGGFTGRAVTSDDGGKTWG